MDELRKLVERFEEGGAESVLRTYLALHKDKIIGMHWLWAVVERVAAGEPVDRVLADYDYRALAAIPAGGWTTGDEVLWTDSSGMYAPEVGTVHARNPDGTYWIDFADGSIASSATASELSPPLAASRAGEASELGGGE